MEASPDVNVFLFTDIEGSTSKWETEHDRMAQAVALHDAILRGAIEGRRGRVIKNTGDGVYAMFADAEDAVQAVVSFQLALADPAATGGMAIRVRCGLHAGPAVERDGDFFGTTINRTARIMGVGHGGQVLLSEAVVDLIRDQLPAELSLRELGAVRLKDLAAPELVSQLVHPGLAHEFPPLRSLEALPNNLPLQLTSFVGRERELAEAKELLGKTRLLTLLGMGGLGKTRLSLQIGADLLDEYPDGVWFLDLAPITDPSLVPSEAAQVLGVREEPGKPLLQTLTAHLKSRKLLVIVDNCEHLMDACANFANTVLRAVRDVRIIATSREALRVPGEQTYPVFPLPVPGRDATVEILSRSDAVQLFVERAQAQKPSFALTEKDAPAIAELVARLEGIPLALELAAARMRALSLQDINKRLQNRFALLTGGGRVLMERQQTLRALVAWSYDLLTENEQLLFDRLAIFAGGFDLAAAEVVCGIDPLMPEDVLDLVASLVDKSLVMMQEHEDETRYRMLETIREYANEGIVRREELAAGIVRHCDHFLNVAKAARDQLKGPEQALGMRRLELDLDNLRAAIARIVAGGADAVIAVKIEVALMRFWILRGYATEGRNNVRAALELPEVQAAPVVHAHALYVGGTLAASQSDYVEARKMLAACLELRRGLGNPARDRGHAVDAGADPVERGRRRAGAPERGGGAVDLPRAQGPHRRGDRPPAPGRDLFRPGRDRRIARAAGAVPRDRARDQAPRARGRVRARAGRAGAGRRRPAGGAEAPRPRARRGAWRRGQARRGDRAVVAGSRRPRRRRRRCRVPAGRPGAARVPRVRDERRAPGLPRGPRADPAPAGPRGRGGAAVRSDRGRTRAAGAAPPGAARAALAQRRRCQSCSARRSGVRDGVGGRRGLEPRPGAAPRGGAGAGWGGRGLSSCRPRFSAVPGMKKPARAWPERAWLAACVCVRRRLCGDG